MVDNAQIVLNAFETLFNKRDYGAFLVSELHSAQCAHSAWTRGTFRLD